MKKFFTVLALGTSIAVFSQKEITFGIAVGYAQNGAFNFGFNGKNIINNLGMYVHVRGLQPPIARSFGTNYSATGNTFVSSIEYSDKKYFGGVGGVLYSFGQSNFSLGAGIGYVLESVIVTTNYVHDWEDMKDERTYLVTSEERKRVSAEVIADYKFTKKTSGLGLQAGYNVVHGGFGMLYYDF